MAFHGVRMVVENLPSLLCAEIVSSVVTRYFSSLGTTHVGSVYIAARLAERFATGGSISEHGSSPATSQQGYRLSWRQGR